MSEVKEIPQLNLKGYGLCVCEILWVEGPLHKIRFSHYDGEQFKIQNVEVFHANEILNLSEMFIDTDLKISNYDEE